MKKVKHIANDIIKYIRDNHDLDETILFNIDCNGVEVSKLIKTMSQYEEIANIEITNSQIEIELYQ